MRLKTRVQPLCIRVSLSKNLVEFRRRSGEKSQIIFSGDMCGGENTARPANVRAGSQRRTARALQSGRKPLCQKVLLFDSFLTALRYALLLEKRSLPSAAVRMPQTMTMSAQMIVVGVSTLVSPRNTAVKKIAQAA